MDEITNVKELMAKAVEALVTHDGDLSERLADSYHHIQYVEQEAENHDYLPGDVSETVAQIGKAFRTADPSEGHGQAINSMRSATHADRVQLAMEIVTFNGTIQKLS